MSELRVRLFGIPCIWYDGQELELPATRQSRSILYYLLHHHPQSQRREVLLATFWPEQSEQRSRHALSQSIWRIRQILPDCLETSQAAVGLAPHLTPWIDSQVFLTLLGAHSTQQGTVPSQLLEEALRLYTGDFLACQEEDWVILERERLRHLYHSALETMVQVEKATGDFRQAIHYGLILCNSDPLRESAHREVIRLYYVTGNPAAALRQYTACKNLLKNELGVDPEEETVNLIREINQRTQIDSVPHLPEPVGSAPLPDLRQPHPLPLRLVGRQVERSAILRHVEQATARQGGVIFLEGEAGIGKTRLIQEIGRDAEWRGAQVLWGIANEIETDRPYGILLKALCSGLTLLRVTQLKQLLDPVSLQVLQPLLPPLLQNTSVASLPVLKASQEKQRILQALTDLGLCWAKVTPLLMVLEDIHWTDPDTLQLLPELMPAWQKAGLLILLTSRSEEMLARRPVWEAVEALDRLGLKERMRLSRLDRAASGELLRTCLGLSSPASLFEQRIHQETDGNPLFLLETVRTLQEEGLLVQTENSGWKTPWDGSTRDYQELILPPLVEQIIKRRLELLPVPLIQTIQTAAVLGREVEFTILAASVKLHPDALLDAINDLVQRHVLLERLDGYHFSHEMVRQVILANLSPAVEIRLHLQAAQALERLSPSQVESLAYHYEKTLEWEKALRYHAQAGEQAIVLNGFLTAIHHFSKVMEIYDKNIHEGEAAGVHEPVSRLVFNVIGQQARAYWMLGQVAEEQAALEILARMADCLADPICQATVLNRRALFMVETCDDYQSGIQLAQQACELSEANHDSVNMALSTDILGRIAYATDQYDQAEQYFRHAIDLWEGINKQDELPQAHIRLGKVLKMKGQLADTKIEFDSALQAAQANQNLLDELYACTNLAVLARIQGQYQQAIKNNLQALTIARQIGHRPIQATTLDNLGVAYWSLRQYGPAIQAMEESLKLVREMKDRRGMVFCLNNLGDLNRESGDYHAAQIYLEEGLCLAIEIAFPYAIGAFHQALGRLGLEKDHIQAARDHFNESITIGLQIKNLALAGNGQFGLALVCHREGLSQAATLHFKQARTSHQAAGENDYATLDLSWLAICALETGDLLLAQDLTHQAFHALESHAGGEEVQRIYYHHWQVLHACGETRQARQALAKAHALVLTQAGSFPDANRREFFLENVQVNRLIIAAWQQHSGLQEETIHCPGRIAPHHPVRVTWTLHTPEDEDISDKVARRHFRLKRLLEQANQQDAAPTRQQLADALRVGVRTIERDLSILTQ